MPSDALTYSFIASELNNTLSGGRIDKITMPFSHTVILWIRANQTNYKVILSADCNHPRAHITTANFINPENAPSFLMHLRKHILGAKINRVHLAEYERILTFELYKSNELGYGVIKRLIVEIMGKYSNVILVDENGKISDAIRRVGLDESRVRQVLPQLSYVAPAPQDKLDVTAKDEIIRRIKAFEGGKIENYILSFIKGLAPVSITEAVNNAKTNEPHLNANSVYESIYNLYHDKISPCVAYANNKAIDFLLRPYKTVGETYKSYNTINEAIDAYFLETTVSNVMQSKINELKKTVNGVINKTQKKLTEFLYSLNSASDYEKDKLKADLITANIYRIKKGDEKVVVNNCYSDDYEEITITLDSTLSPQAQAQKAYKKYNKKKRTVIAINEQIEKAKVELDYFESVLTHIETAETEDDVNGIILELSEYGLIKTQKSKKIPPAQLNEFNVNGFTVTVGKNNLQNDKITKSAKPYDVWLHAQKIHGAHVIIATNGQPVPDDVILFAASKAALYSKAKLNDTVAVDYCQKKYVSKPSGAKAGKVIYKNQKTVFVKPQ